MRLPPRRRRSFPLMPMLVVALLGGASWMFWPGWSAFPAGDRPVDRFSPRAARASTIPEAVIGDEAPLRKSDFKPVWENEVALEPRQGGQKNGSQGSAGNLEEANERDRPNVSLRDLSALDEAESDSGADSGTSSRPNRESESAGDTILKPGGQDRPPPTNAIEETARQYETGDRIDARHKLNAMLSVAKTAGEAAEIRKHLERIAEEMIFSRLRTPNDPLIDVHTVESRETLIEIASRYDIPHQAILLLNPGLDPKRLRPGMDIKIPRGPFHLKIEKSAYRLDVYLQNLYVRSFRVGIGGEQDTPVGVWKIVDRQVDPTYYPPAIAKDKRVIPGKDPRNPLGTHYLKLKGIEGDAVGRTGFAIHGTNEPESIGQAASLGCIRMLNEDVSYLYKLVRSEKTMVTVLP